MKQNTKRDVLENLILEDFTQKKNLVALEMYGTGEKYTYGQLQKEVEKVGISLRKMGLRAGDFCSIYARNSPKWVIVDLAIANIGAVSVPIYWRSTSTKIAKIFQRIKPKLLFVGDSLLFSEISTIQNLPTTILLTKQKCKDSVAWNTFLAKVGKVPLTKNNPKNLARIVFTSGSTGKPKGVMLSHKNVMFDVRKLKDLFEVNSKDVFISYLPLNHMLGLVGEVYTPLLAGAKIVFSDNPKKLLKNIRAVQPSFIVFVPFILEKIYKKVTFSFPFSLFKGSLVSKKPGIIEKLLLEFIGISLREKLGGNVRTIICGGAPLAKNVEQFYTNCSIPLYQGYGMTEASPVISVNSPGKKKKGSVGYPLDSIKISSSKEVYVKGDNVMMGYFNDASKTKEVLHDGWLRTGDIGEIDKRGYLHIFQRRDDTIVLSTGKNLNPLLIEDLLNEHRQIDVAFVYGTAKPNLVALLFVSGNITKNTSNDVRKIIKKVNKELPHYEQITAFHLVNAKKLNRKELKLSRKKILRKYSAKLDALYNKDTRR